MGWGVCGAFRDALTYYGEGRPYKYEDLIKAVRERNLAKVESCIADLKAANELFFALNNPCMPIIVAYVGLRYAPPFNPDYFLLNRLLNEGTRPENRRLDKLNAFDCLYSFALLKDDLFLFKWLLEFESPDPALQYEKLLDNRADFDGRPTYLDQWESTRKGVKAIIAKRAKENRQVRVLQHDARTAEASGAYVAAMKKHANAAAIKLRHRDEEQAQINEVMLRQNPSLTFVPAFYEEQYYINLSLAYDCGKLADKAYTARPYESEAVMDEHLEVLKQLADNAKILRNSGAAEAYESRWNGLTKVRTFNDDPLVYATIGAAPEGSHPSSSAVFVSTRVSTGPTSFSHNVG